MLLGLGDLALDPSGRDEGLRIDYFKPMVRQTHDLLLAKDLKRAADMDVGKTQSLANLALTERQLKNLAALGWKPLANPDVELEKEMCDALPSVPETDIGQVVMRPRLIGGDLTTQQDRETRIGLHDDVQLAALKGVDAHD
jgi:hypothetical protein